jgi:hypothetical protein
MADAKHTQTKRKECRTMHETVSNAKTHSRERDGGVAGGPESAESTGQKMAFFGLTWPSERNSHRNWLRTKFAPNWSFLVFETKFAPNWSYLVIETKFVLKMA